MTETKYYHVIIDGPPGPESGRFVELEDDSGKGMGVGEWIEREDGLWDLKLPIEDPRLKIAVEALGHYAARMDDGGTARKAIERIEK